MRCSKNSSKGIFIALGLPPETGKISGNNLTHHLKELGKEQTKPKVSKRKEIIKFRQEINKIEIKKTENIDEAKSCFFKDKYETLMKRKGCIVQRFAGLEVGK